MKIFAFSDLHHSRARAEALVKASALADLVIGAGDYCNTRQNLAGAMALLKDIKRPFVAVPGNAESIEELREAAHTDMYILHGETLEINGLRIGGIGYGVPVTPFGDWSCDLNENKAAELLAPMSGLDILITHSPPHGVADVTSQGQSVGSIAIKEAIARISPKLVLCGHIHDSWGVEGTIGATRVVNLGPKGRWFKL